MRRHVPFAQALEEKTKSRKKPHAAASTHAQGITRKMNHPVYVMKPVRAGYLKPVDPEGNMAKITGEFIQVVKADKEKIEVKRLSDGKTVEITRKEYDSVIGNNKRASTMYAGIGNANQLYATHCTYGTSKVEQSKGDKAERVLGYSIRSSSIQGIPENRKLQKSVERNFSYYLPTDTPSDLKGVVTHTNTPGRYVYLPKMGQGGHLSMTSYIPKDTAKRTGSYFIHGLANDVGSKSKERFDVLDALSSWNAPGWVREEPDLVGYELPKKKPIDLLGNKPPAVCDKALYDFLFVDGNPNNDKSVDPNLVPDRLSNLSAENRRKVFTKALACFLDSNNRDSNFCLVAEPSTAALIFYGIARLVPEGQRKDMSFSTYESNLDNSLTTLTATTNYDTTKDRSTSASGNYNHSKKVICNTFSVPGSKLEEGEPKTSKIDPLLELQAKEIVAILKGVL